MSTTTPEEIVERFRVDESRVDAHPPDYNVAPRADVYAVRERASGAGERRRFLDLLRWGLVPSWAKDPRVGDRMINARAETLSEKPGYRQAFAKRRCIVAADGFYEWQRRDGRPSRPMHVRRLDGAPLAFAGLWAAWRDPAAEDPDDPWLRSCVIVTTAANDLLAPIHDRMPVVLDERDWDRWLDPGERHATALAELLHPPPDEWFAVSPVSTRVNRPENNGPELLEPVESP